MQWLQPSHKVIVCCFVFTCDLDNVTVAHACQAVGVNAG
jgi:hypothetical protein